MSALLHRIEMAFRAAAEKLTMVGNHVSFTLVSWVVILDNMVGIALYLQTRFFFGNNASLLFQSVCHV